MSVRSRIKEFEKLSQREAENQEKENLNRKNETKRRFHYPGNTTNRQADGEGEHGGHNFILSNKHSKGTQDLDADLQEVWSVRKNIHHKGTSLSSQPHPQGQLPTSSAMTSSTTHSAFMPTSQNITTPAHYSRHGAIPALPAHPNKVQPLSNKDVGRGHESLKQEDATSQDNHASPWNVKKLAYSYNAPTGAPSKNVASPPPTDVALIPSTKRRMNIGGMDVVRPTGEHRSGGLMGNKGTANEKISYAKRMAQGYLKSVGMGDFTPPNGAYSKVKGTEPRSSEPASSSLGQRTTRWKKIEDQDKEFDFDM